jgi:hypothetical protein
MAQQANRSISLLPIAHDDLPFLYRVYASTREDELAQTGWDAAQQESFLRMQFDAQHKYYQEMYADADYQIILLDGEPAGRLYLDRRREEIRIIDIALLTEHRGQGERTSRSHSRREEQPRNAALPEARFHQDRR